MKKIVILLALMLTKKTFKMLKMMSEELGSEMIWKDGIIKGNSLY